MIHELFRGLERTIHERLEIIEEMVRRGSSGPTGPTGPVRLGPTGAEPWSVAISHRLEALERRECPDTEKIMRGHAYLLARIDALEEELRNKPSSLIPPHPLVGIEIVPKKEVTLVDPNPERINEADRLLLNSSARKALQEEEEAEEEVVAEEEVELAEEEELVEEEEEEEAEDEAEELEEFEYKGATYYRDGEKNVFMTDEDGELIPTPIGVWSEVKKRIIVKRPDA
jgi:hypothetical protein